MMMPRRIRLLSQVIRVKQAHNLHHTEFVHAETPEEAEAQHVHRAYGVYNEAEQTIMLDDSLKFERARETFLHENLHAILAITGVDQLLEQEAVGLGEHIVGVVSPVMLAWLRDNPRAVEWLQEVQ